MLELDAGVIGRELPVGFCVMGIALSLPCDDLVDEDLLVGYTLRSASFCARAATRARHTL